MNKKTAVAALCIAAAVIYLSVRQVNHAVSAAAQPTEGHILIDAGHGGRDPGASAADGTTESSINLEVSLSLRDMLTFFGYRVEMTRTADTTVTGEAVSAGWKTQDMHNRLAMYNRALLTVSIHQNHFSQPQYSGAQIFYAPAVAQSRDIADCIRRAIVALLQSDNRREIKPAEKSIFLLTATEKPAVIVEGGFLSNPDEAALLADPTYRRRLAFAVCCGILEYDP